MSNTFLFLTNGTNSYQALLIKELLTKGIYIQQTGPKQFFNALGSYCETIGEDTLTVIIDLENNLLSNEIVHFLSISELLRRPRVIAFASLSTWAGKRYPDGISDPDEEFLRRKPTSSSYDAWMTENSLWGMAISRKCHVCVIGVGLIYGKSGMGLADVFRSLWLKESSNEREKSGLFRIPCVYAGHCVVPMIHLDDLIDLVQEELLSSNSSCGPKFVHATDCSAVQLCDLFPHLDFGSIDDLSVSLLEPVSPEVQLWNCDIYFSNPLFHSTRTENVSSVYECGLTRKFTDIWNEYLESVHLSPLKILVCGGPKAGKTEAARKICASFDLEYVDPIGVIKTILDNLDDVEESIPPRTFDLAALRLELVNFFETTDAQKKSAKKKAPTSERFNSTSVELNEPVIATINPNLVRRCISSFISFSSKCKMKGFVLDVWGVAAETSSDLMQILSTASGENDELEFVLEIQCTESVATKRFLESLGVDDSTKGKMSKDNQAALKTLESQLSSYNSKFRPIPQLPEKTSHEGVLSFEGNKCSVLRSCAGGGEQLSPDLLGAYFVDLIVSVHGAVGWMETGHKLVPDSIKENIQAQYDSVAVVPEDDRVQASNDVLNEALLQERCDELQKYLIANVLPHITTGLIQINREAPSDPISYLEQFIRQVGVTTESDAVNRAKSQFFRVIREVEDV